VEVTHYGFAVALCGFLFDIFIRLLGEIFADVMVCFLPCQHLTLHREDALLAKYELIPNIERACKNLCLTIWV